MEVENQHKPDSLWEHVVMLGPQASRIVINISVHYIFTHSRSSHQLMFIVLSIHAIPVPTHTHAHVTSHLPAPSQLHSHQLTHPVHNQIYSHLPSWFITHLWHKHEASMNHCICEWSTTRLIRCISEERTYDNDITAKYLAAAWTLVTLVQ